MINDFSLHFWRQCARTLERVQEIALNSTSLSRIPSVTYIRLASKGRVSALTLPTTKTHPANNDVCEETAVSDFVWETPQSSVEHRDPLSLDRARHFFVVFVCSSGQRDGGPWCRVANHSGVSNIQKRVGKCTKS